MPPINLPNHLVSQNFEEYLFSLTNTNYFGLTELAQNAKLY